MGRAGQLMCQSGGAVIESAAASKLLHALRGLCDTGRRPSGSGTRGRPRPQPTDGMRLKLHESPAMDIAYEQRSAHVERPKDRLCGQGWTAEEGEERMDRKTSEVLQGTLDLMILKTLHALGPLHGFGIARRIEQVSRDVLELDEGTVYTSLRGCRSPSRRTSSIATSAGCW
jgi:hypothetical protein